MEDTDRVRSRAEFEKALMEDLRYLGLCWDEGPDCGGEFGPYRQSERTGIYLEYGRWLLKKDLAYHCYCSKERLEELKIEQIKKALPPRYDRLCSALKTPPPGVAPVVRFRMPEKTISFKDGVHGAVEFSGKDFGDFIIIDSEGAPSYNFAAALDDSLMAITHVIRGEDHLSNTPRQIAVMRALGFGIPDYFHLPLVTSADGTPLGKREAALSVGELRNEGFLPEAVINAVARLGWSAGEGFLSLKEMTDVFSMEHLSKSPARFDMDSLRRYGRIAISKADASTLAESLEPRFKDVEREKLHRAVETVKDGTRSLNEIAVLLGPILEKPHLSEEAKTVLSSPGAGKVLSIAIAAVEETAALTPEAWKGAVARVSAETGEKGKTLLLPLRVALTGAREGVELEKIARILGKDETIARLKEALEWR
jgi:glutamyl-tRNA synthetase/nondiscriminating glutamyl-tRNA synthetase